MESPAGRFMFQKRNEKIDWRKLASVDVERICQEIDVDAIQNNILSVTYCDIDHELGFGIDKNFTKLFRLAQLTIEYLLHCQEYLQQCMGEKDTVINLMKEEKSQTFQEHEKTKSELKQRNDSYKNLKKELQKLKKLVGDYQLMIKAGSSGLHKCTRCSKSFVSEFYLRSHLERRHPEEARKFHSVEMNYHSVVNQSYRDVEMQNELNQIKSRLRMTEADLRQERENTINIKADENGKNADLFEKFKIEHESWKRSEQEKMKVEIDSYKEMMLSELKQTQKEKDLLQKTLVEIQNATGKRKSMLGDLVDDDGNSIKDLHSQIVELDQRFRTELQKVHQTHEEKIRVRDMTYRKKIEKEQERYRKAEEERIADRKYYEGLISALNRRLSDHEKLFTKSKQIEKDETDGRQVMDLRIKPPEVPPRELAASPAPIDVQLPEQDSVCLWVSVNQSVKHSHRVFRSPASTKGDWKDLFSFHALLQPIGEFQKPIYVYSCGGSPYWRQCVSPNKNPPSPNYKHDYIFYVTTTKLLGTIKLFVHYAGSGTVVRSTISKEEALENWKYKGLYFYAMKSGSPKKTSITRSGTFNSDIFESVSDDDVSVSSFTGTEVVKQNLAEALRRSREDLVDVGNDYHEDQDKKPMDIDYKDEEEEEKKEEEEDRDHTDDKTVNFEGTSSGSLLMTTLPEKGEFYPFPNNPLAVSYYNHPMEMLMAQRKEMVEILDDQLEKRGIDPDESQMTNNVFKSKIKNLEKEGKLKEKSYPGFDSRRQKILEELNTFCEKRKSRKNTEKALTSLAGVVKSAGKLKKKEVKRPLPKLSESTTYTKQQELNKTESKKFSDNDEESKRSSVDDEEEEEEEEEEDDDDDDENANDFIVSDSSEWDSGEEDADNGQIPPVFTTRAAPKSSSVARQQEEEEYRPKLRPPQGAKVKELTKSLEASLSLRDPAKKKLAGAVDLHKNDEQDVNIKRTVSFQDNDNFDNDEDSDFSLSSPEHHSTKIRKKHVYGDNDELNDKPEVVLASYRSSPAVDKNKSFASSTPQPKQSVVTSSKTAVTAFSLEDFDDDDSF